MSSDVILCGVGGQGTVLASRLICSAASEAGLAVKTAETIGMAQRGGSVVSHVRLGEGSSTGLVGPGRAGLVIGFEPAEALRSLGYLAPDATVVTSARPIVPVSAMTGGPAYDFDAIMGELRARVRNLVVVDVEQALADLGSPKVMNVVLLGAAVRTGALPVSEEQVAAAIERLVPERFLELNRRAFAYTSKR